LNEQPYTVYNVDKPRKRRWKRILLWSIVGVVVVVLAVAGTSYLWFDRQVSHAQSRLDPGVESVIKAQPPATTLKGVTSPDPPSAMNIMVIGSDNRETGQEKYGRSDTLMLLHIDPKQNFMSILSIPRDLWVDVPNYGKNKINAAFSFGGPALAVQTVQEVTGIDVDKILEINFKAFQDLTNSLGGVYVDVDRRYYNDDPTWEMIKVDPGYQLLNGQDALDFVRFRHDLNMDFGRMTRQQRFLEALKEQAMKWNNLMFKLPGMVSAIFSNVSTDLTTGEILKLAYWAVNLDSNRVKQISITGETPMIGSQSVVVATKETMVECVNAFLSAPGMGPLPTTVLDPGATSTSGKASSTPVTKSDFAGSSVDVVNGSGVSEFGQIVATWLKTMNADIKSVTTADTAKDHSYVLYPSGKADTARVIGSLVNAQYVDRSSSVTNITVTLGRDFQLPAGAASAAGSDLSLTAAIIPNASEWKALAGMIGYPLQAPGFIPQDFKYADRMPPQGPTYNIDTGGGATKPGLRMMYRYEPGGEKTDLYLGLTETTWLNAPIASKGEEVTHDGVTFTVVGSDQRVDHIWWKKDGVLYFLSNTLMYTVGKSEMLKMAESMIAIPKP
jgi:LCP family protein required for cell wall assembly